MAVGDNLLPATQATKIAQSDKWAAVSRIAGIVAGGVTTLLLAPLIIWGFATIQSSATLLATHTGDIANVQTTVNKIEGQSSADHDDILGLHGLIAILTLRMTTAESAITIFWKRGEEKPADKPLP